MPIDSGADRRYPPAVTYQGGRVGLVAGALLVACAGFVSGQASPPTSPPPDSPAIKSRALLDQYCVTCHNDRLKTANLSLQGLDLTKVAEHADLWEKVVRKLRAGVMPPPDMPRPALAEYEGLRDFLENEIDRAAAAEAS